jgi:hypothetical protein
MQEGGYRELQQLLWIWMVGTVQENRGSVTSGATAGKCTMNLKFASLEDEVVADMLGIEDMIGAET